MNTVRGEGEGFDRDFNCGGVKDRMYLWREKARRLMYNVGVSLVSKYSFSCIFVVWLVRGSIYRLLRASILAFPPPFLLPFQHSSHTILDCNEASIWSEFCNT